jgi:phage-related baseplate assembly protein
MHLIAKFNKLALAFFLAYAEDEDLDNWGVFYDCTRLAGAYPYDEYKFSISEALENDITITAGLVLTDDNSEFEAVLTENVVIVAGTLEAFGNVELQETVSSSSVKTTNITTTLPYVVEATAGDGFINGAQAEKDEEYRYRIFISMADKSTAGSEETYESFTRSADVRIEDVRIDSLEAGQVNVFYYSSQADTAMQINIEEALNAKKVRPLTDTVLVEHVQVVGINVTAKLLLEKNALGNEVLNNAIESLKAGLKSLQKIKARITLSEINDFLRVAGVKEVIIESPLVSYEMSYNQIGVQNVLNITLAS